MSKYRFSHTYVKPAQDEAGKPIEVLVPLRRHAERTGPSSGTRAFTSRTNGLFRTIRYKGSGPRADS